MKSSASGSQSASPLYSNGQGPVTLRLLRPFPGPSTGGHALGRQLLPGPADAGAAALADSKVPMATARQTARVDAAPVSATPVVFCMINLFDIGLEGASAGSREMATNV